MEESLIIDVRNETELSILKEHFKMLGWKSNMYVEGSAHGIHSMPTNDYPEMFSMIGITNNRGKFFDRVIFPLNVEYKDKFTFAYRDHLTYFHPHINSEHPKHISVYEMTEVVSRKYYVLL
jgi:hypothetical protein